MSIEFAYEGTLPLSILEAFGVSGSRSGGSAVQVYLRALIASRELRRSKVDYLAVDYVEGDSSPFAICLSRFHTCALDPIALGIKFVSVPIYECCINNFCVPPKNSALSFCGDVVVIKQIDNRI